MRISYSAFDTFNRCPLQYKFSYIDHLQKAPKVELDFGSLMHSVVENALKKDPIIPDIAESMNLYEEGFKKITFKDDRQKEQYLNVGKEIIKTFYNTLKPGFQDTIATEKRFFLKLNDNHDLSGVIDRVDKLPFGAYEVIDYKTNFKPKTQQDIDKDKQLGIYNLVVKELWPDAKDVRLSMYFLKPDLKLTTTRANEELDNLKNEVIVTADKIEKETDYQPKLNPLCDWCDFRDRCPLQKDKKTESEIDSVVEEYILASNKILELEPKIHQHFDAQKIENFSHKKGTLKRGKNKKLTIGKS